ncbi:MAG: hypothetical protein WCT04_16580 [Planctomycetota bacterium]
MVTRANGTATTSKPPAFRPTIKQSLGGFTHESPDIRWRERLPIDPTLRQNLEQSVMKDFQSSSRHCRA